MKPSRKNRKLIISQLIKNVDLNNNAQWPPRWQRFGPQFGTGHVNDLLIYDWCLEEELDGSIEYLAYKSEFLETKIGQQMLSNLRVSSIDGFPISEALFILYRQKLTEFRTRQYRKGIDYFPIESTKGIPLITQLLDSLNKGRIEPANWFQQITKHALFFSSESVDNFKKILNQIDEERMEPLNKIITIIESRIDGKEPESIIVELWSNPFFKGNSQELQDIAVTKGITIPNRAEGISIVLGAACYLYAFEKALLDIIPIYSLMNLGPKPPTAPLLDIDRFDNEQVIKAVQIPCKSRIYLIGSYDKKITIYNEQVRALRICRALIEESIIQKDFKIGVLGGGIAGVTSAIALISKGYKVDLFEKEDELVQLQIKSEHRYVHPHIFSWPEKSSDWPHAGIPIEELDWKADFASTVASKLLAKTEVIEADNENLLIHRNTKIGNIQELSNSKLNLIGDKNQFNDFDALIVTVGFGSDKHPESETVSYWDSDEITSNDNIKVLISGRGDGALIDAIRYSLKDFNHKDLIDQFSNTEELMEFGNKIAQLDLQAKKEELKMNSFNLYEECKKLTIPQEILNSFNERVPQNTTITILSRSENPFKYQTAVINRAALLILEKLGKINYLQGELDGIKSASCKLTRIFDISSKAHSKKIAKIKSITGRFEVEYDVVVARHGPRIRNNLVTAIGEKLTKKSEQLDGIISAIGLTNKLDDKTDDFFQ